jgi:hypothetical protein
VAVLEYNSSITEDEINGSNYEAISVELSVVMCIEGVLVCIDAATVDDRLISTDSESHSLVLLWSCCVLDPDVLQYESITCNS